MSPRSRSRTGEPPAKDSGKRQRAPKRVSLLPVIVTRRFERALAALLDHYDAIRHLHPDAGSRAWLLIDRVETELPRLLAAQPDIGRPVQLIASQSQAEKNWLVKLAPLTARRELQAREWRVGDFWVLYFRTSNAVYLVSARHEREAGYR